MALQDDIAAAIAANDLNRAQQLIQQAKLQAAIATLQAAVIADGNLNLTVQDWTPVRALWNTWPATTEEQQVSPVAVFDLVRDGITQAIRDGDASAMLAYACIIALAVRRPTDIV